MEIKMGGNVSNVHSGILHIDVQGARDDLGGSLLAFHVWYGAQDPRADWLSCGRRFG